VRIAVRPGLISVVHRRDARPHHDQEEMMDMSAERLEQINAELDGRDLIVKQLDNGRYAIYDIQRKGHLGFDTYTRRRGSFDTLEAAYSSVDWKWRAW
jgi:hypothetical protein